ncbi:hypothetical protein P152DRAFT_454902 [Eremomyces bilateralis CBS 781.70]|uniref:Uncharacterized protein n=1 Tax=Eremomyces bilateralis CBS 781.70 TaxID=1392243 RepID=A0A6G1GF97_9PEZI|nr:uncharacterized protein P152DRAFT_454902 [Eremomyces bilateralis CBS 781.70]KAF1816672.1 hypothetical protein P152DRAFT_454902 [Eremomyces bilateralis CBS 781.70]
MSFPVVFTFEGSARHEVLFISPQTKLALLKQDIMACRDSPNCQELLSKYNRSQSEEVTKLTVRWAREGRDPKIFPSSTIITDQNCEAVFALMQVGVGKDVLEVRIGEAE